MHLTGKLEICCLVYLNWLWLKKPVLTNNSDVNRHTVLQQLIKCSTLSHQYFYIVWQIMCLDVATLGTNEVFWDRLWIEWTGLLIMDLRLACKY